MIYLICGKKVKELLENEIYIGEKFYIRASDTHIFANYIPASTETDSMKHDHKVHLFMSNMNFMSLSVLLVDFIKHTYSITGHKAYIHIPPNKKALKDMTKALLELNRIAVDGMYKLMSFRHAIIFRYSGQSMYDRKCCIQLLYSNNTGLVCLPYGDRKIITEKIILNEGGK